MRQSLKFILLPMGSAGDVHPFIWLARLLQARGHDVVMIVQAAVAELAQRAGVATVTVGDKAQQEELIRHPHLWHPRKAFHLLARHMPEYAREVMPVIEEHIEPGRSVLLGGSLSFGARIFSERWNVPLITVHLQPSLMMSAQDNAVVVAGGEWIAGAPQWLKRGIFNMVHWQVDRQLRKPLGRLRSAAGVPGDMPRGIMRDYWHSPDGVICLFPEWYAPKAADWPRQAVLTRFPLYDEADVLPQDSELARFLATGRSANAANGIIVATPGSANAQAARFLKEAATACQMLGRRAILATRYPEQAPQNLPDSIRTFEYIPFSRVFPHAAQGGAVIHHGGIGTMAQCLAAGAPQLIMAMAHDQPDNGARVRRMGVGDYLYPRAFTAKRIAEKLERLTTAPEVKAACTKYRQKMAEQMSPDEMGELIENTSERALRVRQINGIGVPA